MNDETITIGSAHVELGSSFREQAETRIRDVARKYLGDLTLASVHVAREGGDYRCSVNMQMAGNGMTSAEARGPDVPLAFRTALQKVEKQLRRTKRLLREDRAHQPDRITTA